MPNEYHDRKKGQRSVNQFYVVSAVYRDLAKELVYDAVALSCGKKYVLNYKYTLIIIFLFNKFLARTLVALNMVCYIYSV